MNQVQRDLTYRHEAVEKICEQNGYDSQICQESIQVWESQHNTNIFSSKVAFFGEIIFVIFAILVLGYFLYFQYLKSKTKGSKK